MSTRLQLAERHGALRARIAEQRRTLAVHAAPLEHAFGNIDKARAGVDWLKAHPAAVAALAAVMVVINPKRAFRWGQRGFLVWRGWQALRNSLVGTR